MEYQRCNALEGCGVRRLGVGNAGGLGVGRCGEAERDSGRGIETQMPESDLESFTRRQKEPAVDCLGESVKLGWNVVDANGGAGWNVGAASKLRNGVCKVVRNEAGDVGAVNGD